jgi:hypothetical protein
VAISFTRALYHGHHYLQYKEKQILASKALLASSGVSNSTKAKPLIFPLVLYLGSETYATFP